ncbi:Transmembrane GTPase fzo1 [Erysiphe necator]|uniref:Putative transmembrane gtpase fzo1 n=1 Tax=Uncinula necator TaxID=52586 RepID=A0A0B1PDX7_UNCNE|nr:Transmembrane GTPase fzo1 [Erysiphe necator]KHJ35560.1 putative transmembrane gtpase fzo1 [Erysiphe necator]
MSEDFESEKERDLGEESWSRRSTSRPEYLTVGNGSTSENKVRLQALLESDSGYGGSCTGDSVKAWDPTLYNQSSLPQTSSTLRTEIIESQLNDRRTQTNAIHQLWYNQHRVTLARSINRVIETLSGLQEMNSVWPACYPTVQRAEIAQAYRRRSRPPLNSPFSSIRESKGHDAPHHIALHRAQTSPREDNTTDTENTPVAEQKPNLEPRLITPQIAQEFSILKLDLKLGAMLQSELVHSLEKGSIASLLDGKIRSSIKHLLSLRERIEDTSSKVLVTGDLNAGKSTFCNALLRRKILPEDQQPCTSIFCEVLDVRENGGIEEVHAVHRDAIYNRYDESSYDVFGLADLEQLVISNDVYTQCKIYIRDIRTIDESLLNNGVVDISIIDAPGLNMDTTKTTAVFARQEEIDVVVFVVSAANHFTITAQEFIWAAASEKAYIFIVVNGYDNIRDKDRCQKMILKQIAGLSPRTHKENAELVHFVSSNAIPTALPIPPYGNSDHGDGYPSGDPPDFDGNDPKGKGKAIEKEKIRDFEKLEQSLRRFVLEKRARSKLAPAKTYLLNLLGDLQTLADVNLVVAKAELDRVTRELNELEPILEQSKKAKEQVNDEIDRTIESTCKEVYDYTRSNLTSSLHYTSVSDLGISYPGLWSSFQYAEDLKDAMLSQISVSVTLCEEFARNKTIEGVDLIKELGVSQLGDEYSDLSFRSDVMFQRKKDILAKQIDVETEIWDFFDWSSILNQQEKMAGTGVVLTVATAMSGKVVGTWAWADGILTTMRAVGINNVRRVIVPGILVTAIAAMYYAFSQIPSSLPKRLSTKISMQLQSIDFVHRNSDRISSSVRKVLRFPADNLRVGLQRNLEQLGVKQTETKKIRGESEVARKYFSNLVNESRVVRNIVEAVDLEGSSHGITMNYEIGS